MGKKKLFIPWAAKEVLSLLLLFCLFEIIEEERQMYIHIP